MNSNFVLKSNKHLLMITCNDLIVYSEPTLTRFGAAVYLKYTKKRQIQKHLKSIFVGSPNRKSIYE